MYVTTKFPAPDTDGSKTPVEVFNPGVAGVELQVPPAVFGFKVIGASVIHIELTGQKLGSQQTVAYCEPAVMFNDSILPPLPVEVLLFNKAPTANTSPLEFTLTSYTVNPPVVFT